MARDLDVIRRYCTVGPEEERALVSAAAPIVLLAADRAEKLPDEVAPGLATLGFMLPTTPLHLLILARMERPVVMTSGNVSEEPQVIDDDAARARLGDIATYALMHDREIANRVDNSVARVMAGRTRILRRARGFAPAPIALPPGFEAAPELLAMGGELKATFCLVKDGEAILSQHQGDLENAETFDDYRKNLALYAELFDHAPRRSRRRSASGISVGQARARMGASRSRCRSSKRSTITPMSRRALPKTAFRSTRLRCSASSSMDWAGATTGRSGAGNSCSRIIAVSSGSARSSRWRCWAARKRRASRGAISTPI